MTIKKCLKCGENKKLLEFTYRNDSCTYRNRCKACSKLYNDKHYKNNRKEILKKRNAKTSKEETSIYNKLMYDKHKLRNRKYRKEYYIKHKEKCNLTTKKWAQKHKNDPIFKIGKNMRRRVLLALKGNPKYTTTFNLVGCSRQQLIVYLESKFQIGMTWENHGLKGWHIDHIIPCASFDLSKEAEQKKCFNYTNLQPLWAGDNLSKGNKII